MENYVNIISEAMSMFEILKKQGLVMSIALSDIVPNPAQPRRTFDEKELFALGIDLSSDLTTVDFLRKISQAVGAGQEFNGGGGV